MRCLLLTVAIAFSAPRYLEGLLRRGANVKFFSEGGRSRSGKLQLEKNFEVAVSNNCKQYGVC